MNDQNALGCRKLWQRMITHNICGADGFCLNDITYSGKKGKDTARLRQLEKAREIQRCKDWIGSKDFRWQCELAGFDPDFLAEAYWAGRIDTAALAKGHHGRVNLKQYREAAE